MHDSEVIDLSCGFACEFAVGLQTVKRQVKAFISQSCMNFFLIISLYLCSTVFVRLL